MPDIVLALDGWEAVLDTQGVPTGIRWWGRTSFPTAPVSIPLQWTVGGMLQNASVMGVGDSLPDGDGNYRWSLTKMDLPLETEIFVRDDSNVDMIYVYTSPVHYIGAVSPLLLRYVVDGFAGVIPSP